MLKLIDKLPYSIVIIVLVASLMTGCKNKQQLSNSATTLPFRSPDFLKQQLIQQQVNADWLTAKMKINFDNNGQQQKAFATLKMRKDSIIWMNIKKLGIEGARLQITRDSVYLLDRINAKYTVKPLSFITEKFNLPTNFSTLQNFLLGNVVFFTNALIVSQKDLHYQLLDISTRFNAQYWINSASYRLSKIAIADYDADREVTADYADYQLLPDEQYFPHVRNVHIDDPEAGRIGVQLQFSEVIPSRPTAIRFSIPPHYERAD